jgi:hypothetical protein
MPFRAAFEPGTGKQDRGATRRKEVPPMAGSDRGSDLAVVPKIDHHVGERLECVVRPADALETQKQPAELVLRGKQPLDRPEALFEVGRLEDWLAASLRLLSAARIGIDVGTMPRLKIALRLTRQS